MVKEGVQPRKGVKQRPSKVRRGRIKEDEVLMFPYFGLITLTKNQVVGPLFSMDCRKSSYFNF